jgi:lipoprotein-anchoring transpeptidase ErfK/SrfK
MIRIGIGSALTCCVIIALSSCSSMTSTGTTTPPPTKTAQAAAPLPDYTQRLPGSLATGEKTILIDPNVHAWGAYDSSGNLLRAGLATAGANYCADIHRACRTKPGSFRIQSLGAASCKSSIYPLPKGGAPMPYCMFFNKNQGLHGSPYVMEGNASHGCVRVRVSDAEWIRFNFANIGTKVIVKAY